MKKILIISYFFPPCNLTASNRVGSWAQYLHKFGVYPIIVTRKWERHVETYKDCHYDTTSEIQIDKNSKFEVHYVPYKGNFRDRLLLQNKWILLRKLLSLIELLGQNIFPFFCPFLNLQSYCDKYLTKNRDVDLIIVSGNPFIQFRFAYYLSLKHKLPWIADYRDAWTTSTINNIDGKISYSLINKFNRYFEKKWIKSAALITSSSSPIGKSISAISNRPYMTIHNGYEPSDFTDNLDIKKNDDFFQLAYIGTLYDGQDISIFLEAYKQFIEKKKPRTLILFPGLELDKKQQLRVQKIMRGYEGFYKTSARIPKTEIIKIERSSHLLLHVAWKGHDGIVASKIYEYIGSGTDILIVPGDKGCIDEIIKESKAGFIFYNVNHTYDFLCSEYEKFLLNNSVGFLNTMYKERFTRENQAKVLSDYIINSR